MRAIQFSRFGGPDVLEAVEIPTPAPRPGEVLVRVGASGINLFETLLRQDRYAMTPELPMVPGVEIAGVVEALGAGATALEIGTRVAVPMFAFERQSGGYAEYVAIDAAAAVSLPGEVSFADATALMIQGLTALHLVRRTQPRGKTVLVNAAAGGVGSLLLQLARRAGATRVLAAASTEDKLDLARSLGADFGVDYTKPGWAEHVRKATDGAGADIVYESVGGEVTSACLDALAPLGELTIFGALNIQAFALGVPELKGMIFKNQSLRGFALLPLLTPQGLKADLAELFDLATRGELKVTQGGSFPLERAAAAHDALENRRTTGKLVLTP
jgi:NADPH2:quinone reductase